MKNQYPRKLKKKLFGTRKRPRYQFIGIDLGAPGGDYTVVRYARNGRVIEIHKNGKCEKGEGGKE